MKKQKAPPVDIRKVLRAAAEAALEEPAAEVRPKRRHLRAGRTVVLGAGALAAGRLLVRGRQIGLLNSIEERLAGLGVEVPGKPPVEPELDDEELVDEAADEVPDDELELAEEEGSAEEPSDGGAPRRQPRRKGRGRA